MLRLRDKQNSSPVNSRLAVKHLLGCYKKITVLPQTNDNRTQLDSNFLVVITAKAANHSSEKEEKKNGENHSVQTKNRRSQS